MAEAALFGLATKVANTVASPLFQKAYETASSIWGANNALEKLKISIELIKERIQGAEQQNEGSKILLGRLRDVLYDAEDLFDTVTTNVKLKQQMDDIRLPVKKVKLFLSKLNPIISGYITAMEVKAIRLNLEEIRADMAGFQVLPYNGAISTRIDEETGPGVDPNIVIGREIDKDKILGYINDETYANRNISVIAIVGIGGMGKSTVAQFVYNDQTILNEFSKERMWWAYISSATVTEMDVAKKIYSSITPRNERTNPENLRFEELQSEIKERIEKNGKFFLVLDDLWGEGSIRWKSILGW